MFLIIIYILGNCTDQEAARTSDSLCFSGEKIIQPHLNCKSQEDPELITIVKVQGGNMGAFLVCPIYVYMSNMYTYNMYISQRLIGIFFISCNNEIIRGYQYLMPLSFIQKERKY